MTESRRLLLELSTLSKVWNLLELLEPSLNIACAALLLACLATAACGEESEMAKPSPAEIQAVQLTARKALKPIPEPFRNIWAVNVGDCPHIDGPTRLSIDPASISFAKSRFDVASINEVADNELLLEVRFGHGPLQTHILKVGQSAETLSYIAPGIMTTFNRCPA